MIGVRLIGDWAKATKSLEHLEDRFARAAEQAVAKEAQMARMHIVKNITSGGAHADKPFAPLSSMTLAIRAFKGFGGGKPLIVSGALLGAVTVSKIGKATFVGIKRAGGKGGGVNFAELHEFGGGPWTRPMTDKQRRFLHAALKNAGPAPTGPGGGVLTIRIPARPYIGPVADKFLKQPDVKRRFWANVSAALGGDIGRP